MKVTQVKKLAFILSAIALLQGCTANPFGGGGDSVKVGSNPRTISGQFDDETLEFKVENAIDKDEQINDEGRVNAISYSGRVLLIGQVPSEAAKQTAESLTEGVNGVKEVYNELRVAPKISIAQITEDSWITTQIKSKLLVNDQVKTTDVKVITENGEVFLLGDVTQDQGNAAAQLASQISGVKKVIKVFYYLN